MYEFNISSVECSSIVGSIGVACDTRENGTGVTSWRLDITSSNNAFCSVFCCVSCGAQRSCGTMASIVVGGANSEVIKL